jgi:hypothetical protein
LVLFISFSFFPPFLGGEIDANMSKFPFTPKTDRQCSMFELYINQPRDLENQWKWWDTIVYSQSRWRLGISYSKWTQSNLKKEYRNVTLKKKLNVPVSWPICCQSLLQLTKELQSLFPKHLSSLLKIERPRWSDSMSVLSSTDWTCNYCQLTNPYD